MIPTGIFLRGLGIAWKLVGPTGFRSDPFSPKFPENDRKWYKLGNCVLQSSFCCRYKWQEISYWVRFQLPDTHQAPKITAKKTSMKSKSKLLSESRYTNSCNAIQHKENAREFNDTRTNNSIFKVNGITKYWSKNIHTYINVCMSSHVSITKLMHNLFIYSIIIYITL
jgi:hypothetical protein